jgi:hypothetical protein
VVLEAAGDYQEDRERNEEVLQLVKEDRNILQRVKRRRAN